MRSDVVRRVPFRVDLRVPVGGVTERSGWLIEGPAGWGELSPLPSWSAEEREAAERAAIEAATLEFPPTVRRWVEINALVPRVPPEQAAELARASGCRTIKIKVGDEDSVARVRAVREACPDAQLRLDANGAWDLMTAKLQLARLVGSNIEFVEDPVATLHDLARLHEEAAVPIAAENCIRTVGDARRLRALRAADVFVVKPQRIGGVRAALAAAEEAGCPTVVSCALETSVGLAAVLAVAAALPAQPYAAGIGTASLLERDVTDDPLVPDDGLLVPRRVAPSEAFLAAASHGAGARDESPGGDD